MSQERQLQLALAALLLGGLLLYYIATAPEEAPPPVATAASEPTEPAPQSTQQDPGPHKVQYAVYTNKPGGAAKATALLTKMYAGQADVHERTLEDYALPKDEHFAAMAKGVDDAQKKKVYACDRAVVVDFSMTNPRSEKEHVAAAKAIEALATALDGFPWDESTRQIMSIAAWHERRVAGWSDGAPNAILQVNWHFYETDNGYRFVSLGMNKLGGFELTYLAAGGRHANQLTSVLNLTAQLMLEGEPIDEPGEYEIAIAKVKHKDVRESLEALVVDGAHGTVTLHLKEVEPEDGDNQADQLAIAFPGDNCAGTTVCDAAAISALFGAAAEQVSATAPDDEELLAARDRARKKISGEIKRWFEKGRKAGDSLSVKAPFKTYDGNTEWMWLEVTKWKGKRLDGILQNEPEDVSTLALGDKVSAKEDELYDYLRERANGTSDGNETGAILRRRAGVTEE
ncbi:MAG: DUF2314 domain-containing protein [Deltaproteobacteria bacterium]|nr:DUF2314 domain-containing protein [Deltaproteobacteria bacterium]